MTETARSHLESTTHHEPTAQARDCAVALFQRYGDDARMYVAGRCFAAIQAHELEAERFWRAVYAVLCQLHMALQSPTAVSDIREPPPRFSLDPKQEVERWAAFLFRHYGDAKAVPFCGSLIFQSMENGDRQAELFWRDVGIRLLNFSIDPTEAQEIGAMVH